MSYQKLKELRSTLSKFSAALIAFMLFTAVVLVTVTNASAPESEVGKLAPDFSLKDTDGKTHKLGDYKGKTVVLEWTNPGCPFVVGHYKTGNMQQLQEKYTEAGVVWLTVNSTNPAHPNHLSAEALAEKFQSWESHASANLLDEDGKVGELYGAKTTPHMFIIDKNGKLAYAGAIDDDRSTNGGANASVNYVAQALDELLAGKSVSVKQTKQYGCGVKY
ncbi:alkyl hydroperoxide reductase/ Thiol specific antioxidant/ Mal allergen [Chloroherpeton thalassium ATCC 35110]|uniref:Alkyl hydroperoxide reductase/ Thiol specific antioxidant/ Mal allergen n=1 Tax=Chloroherpeton thalassium (strain ATCC 35110 / GB-78) TaxID=517418 RepID=B3QTF9_CHLT3|nr:thioredoxin family protein [Chloroherpeton thalassium]ACF12705.1 alkyl hydroperoxide reductase/ Thiol specific antioxidant/ Mal allergen [Chloroherpeton thalassium ATCC 35110]